MKEKGIVKKALLQMLAVAAEDEMDINIYSWPPICVSLLYQPERPRIDLVGKICEEKNHATNYR